MPGLVPPARPKPLRRGEGPGIHVLSPALQGVDGRGKPGHDGGEAWPQASIAYRLNVHRLRAIDIHPPFSCTRLISVDLSPGFFVTLTVAWRRFMFALVLLASPPAGASVAFGFDAIELAQAQPEAQPSPAPSPTPSASPAPATEAQPAAVEPIGNVATVTGIATVIRDKNSYPLRVRDDIYLNDVVQTSSNSSLGITFDDATTFNLSASTKITIDTYVYEDGGKHNAGIFDIGKGTVAFVAAAVAKTGDMKITTPTATLGIRGTTGVVEVPEGAAAKDQQRQHQALSRRRWPGRTHRRRRPHKWDPARRADARRERFCDPAGRSRGRRHALCRGADHDSRTADRARPRLRQPGASGADHGPADRHRAARLPPRQSDREPAHSAAVPAAATATIAAEHGARTTAATAAAAGPSAGPRWRRAARYAARRSGSAATRPETRRGTSGRPTARRSRHAA
jgi:hypothetical protein